MLHICIGTYPRKRIDIGVVRKEIKRESTDIQRENQRTKELVERIGTSRRCIDYADKCLKSLQRHETY